MRSLFILAIFSLFLQNSPAQANGPVTQPGVLIGTIFDAQLGKYAVDPADWSRMAVAIIKPAFPTVNPDRSQLLLPPNGLEFVEMKKRNNRVQLLAIDVNKKMEGLEFHRITSKPNGHGKLWEFALIKEGRLLHYQKGPGKPGTQLFTSHILWTPGGTTNRILTREITRLSARLVQNFIRLTPKI